MEGVEILSTQEVATAWGFCWIGFWTLIVAGLILGSFSWFAYQGDRGTQIFLAVIAIVLSFAGALFVGFNADESNRSAIEYETQYKVTISDKVSMNDFLEKYEILNQEGKIYTVRERDGDKDGK